MNHSASPHFKVPGRITFSESFLRSIRKRRHNSQMHEGDVYTRPTPEDIDPGFVRQTLASAESHLNKRRKKWQIHLGSTDNEIAYGKGNVDLHSDGVYGLSLLTLVYANGSGIFSLLDPKTRSYTDTVLAPGESLVFDDYVCHSWRCEGEWFFVVHQLTLAELPVPVV